MRASGAERWFEILRCPISRQRLTVLFPEELAECNRQMDAGTKRHRDGSAVKLALTCALGTPERRFIYRIEEDIAWLLADLAIVEAVEVDRASITGERRVVQSFYDEFGWVRTEGGVFNDTAAFTETRPTARDYQSHCHARIGRELPGGRFLLDAASGPIPHLEYLEYSRAYQVRVCVDFSIRGLREARRKLGDGGLYLLGDITRLPLADGAVDHAISLHTVYHVPQAEQAAAVAELVRVTKVGGRVVVVYVWSRSAAMALAFGVRHTLGRIRRLFRPSPAAAGPARAAENQPPPIYYAPHDYAWFRREIAARYRTRLRVWSGVNMTFQHRFLTDDRAGRLTVKLVERLEDWLPWLAGRFGQFPMFVIEKDR